MQWCGGQATDLQVNWFAIGDERLGKCLCETLFFPIPSVVFVASVFHRWHVTSHYLPFYVLDFKTRVFLATIQVALGILSALIITFFFLNDVKSIALLICTATQAFAYLMCIPIVSREAWRLTEWPGIQTRFFLVSSCFVNFLSIVLVANEPTLSSAFFETIVLFASSILLCIFVFLKDSLLRSAEEKERLELDRVSVDVFDGLRLQYFSNEYSSRLHSVTRRGVWNAGGFFQLLPGDESPTNDKPMRGGISSWVTSWFVSDRSELWWYRQNHLEDPLVLHDSRNFDINCNQEASPPLVRSALDARLENDAQWFDSNLFNSSHTRIASHGILAPEKDLGLALQRALEPRVRTRLESQREECEARVRGSIDDASVTTHEQIDPGGGAADFNLEKLYTVSLERWGLRHELSTTSSDINVLDKSNVNHKVAEVEFEIRVVAAKSRALVGDWSTSSTSAKTTERSSWSVWRTADEVIQLHSALVAAFGDLSPRKPRLRLALHSISAGSSYSPSDIAADMRAIGIYISALLRGKLYLDFPAVLSFLEVWYYDSTASQVAHLGLGHTSTTDAQEKWRKLFVSLRVRVKPSEIGVRCRLFEGVVSGAEVSSWLTLNGYSRRDALAVGQSLINCGLLVVVSSGFGLGEVTSTSPDQQALEDGVDVSARPSLVMLNDLTISADDEIKQQRLAQFNDQHGFLYTFQQKHSTSFAVGKYVLFGAAVNITIPQWARKGDVEQATGVSAVRSTATHSPHVVFKICCRHGGDEWTTWRRYREFVELRKQLLLLCVRTTVDLPAGGGVLPPLRASQNQGEIDQRRISLELYLANAIDAVIQFQGADGQSAQVVVAQFIDDRYNSLLIVS